MTRARAAPVRHRRALGEAICTDMGNGWTIEREIPQISVMNPEDTDLLSPTQSRGVITAAVNYLCPQYKSKLSGE